MTEPQISKVKQYLVEQDYDFHHSTGANHAIIGVIGDTGKIDPGRLKQFDGVLEVFKIPKEG
ncbi:MAG: hypothetical protein Kow00100_14820 [Geothermobacteraceae bacterium]